MKQFLFSIYLFLIGQGVWAQQTLTLQDFLDIVRRYHPVAKQASLGVDIAKAEVTSARGAFDPRFENNINRKEFEGLAYYNHQITELKIPTWYGVEITAGIESLAGQRTSITDTKGNSGYVGFSVPIAKGLLTDARRATLQQVKLFQQRSVQEQRAMVNDLLYQAAEAYVNWWQQHQTQRLLQQAVKNAEERFRLVKTSFQIGERPAIDTVEALAQWQSFEIRAGEVQLEATNAQINLNVFLWLENGDSYGLSPAVMPQEVLSSVINPIQMESLLQELQLHPELQQYRFKLEALRVEKRLKFQSLLPSVYLKYNQLSKSHQLQKAFTTPWLENNYRYAVAIAVPLRLSEGRGEYRKAKLKIEQTQWQQLNKKVSLQTKFQQYYNEWMQLRTQIVLQERVMQSYNSLQKGEEIKFINGESSLFLLNAREQETLEAQQKLIDLKAKEQKAALGTLWIAGKMVDY